MVNPLVQGGAVRGGGGGGGYAAPPESTADLAPTAPSHGSSGFTLGNIGGGLSHPDNTSAHVAAAVTLAFLVVIGVKLLGFRFSVDAGVAGG